MNEVFNLLSSEIKEILLNFNSLRIDIFNMGSKDNSIKIMENSDPNSRIIIPHWLKDDAGDGLVVSSFNNSIKLKIQCVNDGILKIHLRSRDVRDKNNNRFPIHIDCTQFKINGLDYISENLLISHDNPFTIERGVKNSDIIDIELKWMPFNRSSSYNTKRLNSDNIVKKFSEQLSMHESYLDDYNKLFNTLFVDYNHKPNKLLNNIFSLCTELMSFVENICNSHNLEFWLDCGTLLGAVRHNNFIPWDDDTDIGMIRKDYIQLDNILEDQIKEHNLLDIFHLQHRMRKIDDSEVPSFIQLFVNHKLDGGGKTPIMAGVDIFPYDYLIDYDEKNFDNKYYQSKLTYYRNLSKNNGDSLEILYDDLNLSLKKAKYIVPGVEGAYGPHNIYKLYVIESYKVFPLNKIKFADRQFNSPNDYHTYLKLIYGDYMMVPKNIRIHNRVNNFKYLFNNDKLFKECITRLKEVNNTY